MIEQERIRNFAILAHIDHGKSTLADRLLETTKTVEKREMKEQLLDQMDLERERGITIKLQPATMKYYYKNTSGNSKFEITKNKQIQNNNNQNSKQKNSLEIDASDLEFSDSEYMLNLIDTPGHVDFGYEVSRSLAAVEGAVLLVDATKGVQAQTLANLYQAIEQDLEVIPVLNKIDLPNAEIEKTKAEIIAILGCKEEEILLASGKTGEGVDLILERIVEKVPAPKGNPEAPLRALIFDSKYDSYKGVLAFVRIVDGGIKQWDKIKFIATKAEADSIEVGKFRPQLDPKPELKTGEVGYIATGLKSVEECRVGDTITLARNSKFKIPNPKQTQDSDSKKPNTNYQSTTSIEALPGYKIVHPMVYASFYPVEGEDYNQMRDALDKLKLNDAALAFEGESSQALGRGFRIGFLGLLHLEIVQERLKREFGFNPVITSPSVVYKIVRTDGVEKDIYSASEVPDANLIKEILEPMVKLDIISPSEYLGSIMNLVNETTRASYVSTEYLDKERIVLHFDAPLSEVIINFHDALKSATSGFASMNYEVSGYRPYDLVRMDIYVAEDKVNAFSQIVPRERAISEGRRIVGKLKDLIPRQNFLIKIQAAIGGKMIARENIKAFRKDVTGHLYGGDITRKRKLLEKQKRGKKRMTQSGRAEIPQKAFLEVMKK